MSNMEHIFYKLVNDSDRAILVFEPSVKKSIYSNKLAGLLYGDEEGFVNLEEVFSLNEVTSFLLESVKEDLNLKKHAYIYDKITLTKQGEERMTDIQVGYVDETREQLYLFLSFQSDDSEERLKSHIDHSHRGEILVLDDENFTISYSNLHFYKMFSLNPNEAEGRTVENLATLFVSNQREKVLQSIQSALKKSESHYVELELQINEEERSWFALDLHYRHVGNQQKLLVCFTCIAEKVATANKLASLTRYFNVIQTLSTDLLFRYDVETRTLYRNEETAKFYGIAPVVKNYPDPEQIKGVIHPEDMEDYMVYIHSLLMGVEGTHVARMISPSGEFEYHRFTFKQFFDNEGVLTEMVGKAENIQELKELETRATYDLLTNTLNKISFQEQVTHILAHSSLRSHHALFFIDLDGFKGINDNLGHSFGDVLLKTVGERLRSLVRGRDLVGRVGGDEFVVFLESCGDEIHLKNRAEQMLNVLREEYSDQEVSAVAKGSIGIAVYPDHGTSYKSLYERADKALYYSKHMGKDVATIFTSELEEET